MRPRPAKRLLPNLHLRLINMPRIRRLRRPQRSSLPTRQPPIEHWQTRPHRLHKVRLRQLEPPPLLQQKPTKLRQYLQPRLTPQNLLLINLPKLLANHMLQRWALLMRLLFLPLPLE